MRGASAIGFLLWCGGVVLGWLMLTNYATRPTAAAETAAEWPAEVTLERDPGKATLIIAAHPLCPCTQATVGELAELMALYGESVTTYVLFFEPMDSAEGWAKADLWQRARAIPGVRTIIDRGGRLRDRFGARSSGQTFLYDAQGKLVFAGGVTPSRGHSGDSVGRSAIEGFLATGKISSPTAPVFGCSLVDPSEVSE